MKSYKQRQMEKVRTNILKNIQALEQKRKRSEFSIIDSLYRELELDSEDIRYFNAYTAEIRVLKEELEQLDKALKEMGL